MISLWALRRIAKSYSSIYETKKICEDIWYITQVLYKTYNYPQHVLYNVYNLAASLQYVVKQWQTDACLYWVSQLWRHHTYSASAYNPSADFAPFHDENDYGQRDLAEQSQQDSTRLGGRYSPGGKGARLVTSVWLSTPTLCYSGSPRWRHLLGTPTTSPRV